MKNPSQELSEIKSMMEKSKRFLSLSGIAGIPVGIIALVGITAINLVIHHTLNDWLLPESFNPTSDQLLWIGSICITMFGLATLITWILSTKKASKKTLVSPASKQFIEVLSIPIVFGAFACILFAWKGLYTYIPGMSLMMYGMGIIQASLHTFQELKRLGLILSVLGLMAFFSPTFGVIFWAIGFGGMHIIYGIWMYSKYDR